MSHPCNSSYLGGAYRVWGQPGLHIEFLPRIHDYVMLFELHVLGLCLKGSSLNAFMPSYICHMSSGRGYPSKTMSMRQGKEIVEEGYGRCWDR